MQLERPICDEDLHLGCNGPDLAPAFRGSSGHPTSGNLLAKWQAAIPPIDLSGAGPDNLEFGTPS